MKSMLFTRTDSAVNQQLASASFDIVATPQTLAFHAAPDQDDPSFTIDEAKIGLLSAKRSKNTSAWRLVFTATCSPESEHQLAQIVDAYLKMRYVTFSDAHPDLFSELGDEARKTRKAARSAGAGAAAATH